MKELTLRRPDVCADCAATLAAGKRARWDQAARTVHCLTCSHTTTPAARVPRQRPVPAPVGWPAAGVRGGSAQREYERRAAKREGAVRCWHPRLRGLILALSQEPASTRVWAQGAAGERAVAARLEQLGEAVCVLHDRAVRRPDGRLSRANIDHLAVTPAGVWVIDAKTHRGALEVRRTGGLFSPRVATLYIGGRD